MSTDGRQDFIKLSNSNVQDILGRGNSPTHSNSVNFSTHSGWMKKQIERLQKQAKAQKQKRQEVETKYENFKERNVHRQQEFYKVLQKFNTAKQNLSNDVQISQIYHKIMCTFDDFNEKARELLDDRYSELYQLMERRVDILMQKMDKQLGKYRKVSVRERKEIQQAIKEIGAIAAQTENQNIAFRKTNSELKLKVQMLNDEKKIMLQEIVILKSQIIKLNQKQKTFRTKSDLKNDQTFVFDNLESTKIEMMKTQQFHSARVSTTKRNSKYDQKQTNNHAAQRYSISTMKTIDFGKTGGNFLTNQQNTINHLKQCLQRQKNKNLQLIKFSLELQSKQQKIKELIVNETNNNINEQNYFNTEYASANNGSQTYMHGSQGQNKETQEIDQSSKLSKLIKEISKIFHLPQQQQSLNNSNTVINTIETTREQTQKQNKYCKDKKSDAQLDINTPNCKRRRLSVRKQTQTPQSKFTHRSIVFNNERESRKLAKNTLFFYHSPLKNLQDNKIN